MPAAHERALVRAVQPMIAQVRATLPKIERLQDVRALGAALRRQWPDGRIREIVTAAGERVEAAGSRPWARFEPRRTDVMDASRRRRQPYDGRKLLDEWSRDASGLITSVRDEVAEGMRRDVLEAIEQGADPAQLADKWRRQGVPVLWGTLEGRVKVIAHHQLRVLHARVQKERAHAVGVQAFMWRTQGDDRVRDEHRALADTRHEYAKPPSEGLPGEPINCRCWAESIVTAEVLADLGIGPVFE